MRLTPDQHIFWQVGAFKLNATILTTWFLMLLIATSARIATRRLTSDYNISRWQNVLEIIVGTVRSQMAQIGLRNGATYISFVGTLFIFIAASNACTIFPFYEPPTGSLSTTAALAIAVFVAVPVFGVSQIGLWKYLKTYAEPTFLMVPFNFISELTRTFALAVRLFGNVMSGSMIIGILVSIAPLFFPILMIVLGLLTGAVQAYIFSVLATVYIAAAVQAREERKE